MLQVFCSSEAAGSLLSYASTQFQRERACAQAVIVSEMRALYNCLKARQQPSLPRLAVQYVDYAAWQRARLASGELSGSVKYWQRSLRGVPVLQLPTDRPHPAAGISSSGGRVDIRVPVKTVAALRALTADCGTTLFTTMLAAWKVPFVVIAGCLAAIPHDGLGPQKCFSAVQVLLYRYTRQEDIAVGSPMCAENRYTCHYLGYMLCHACSRGDCLPITAL